MKQFIPTLIVLLLCGDAWGDILKGSEKAISEAKKEADEQAIFTETKAHLDNLVQEHWFVPLKDGEYFDVEEEEVSYEYTLPTTKLFLSNVSEYVFGKCQQKIAVTSAVRPLDEPRRNSADDTVHPTGMALDLRQWNLSLYCQDWFESRLRYLESQGVIQATTETEPAHYHVVVYPRQYTAFASQSLNQDQVTYRVRYGDTLSTIAKRFGTAVTSLTTINELESPHHIWEKQIIKLF